MTDAPDFDLQRDMAQAAEMSAADHERGDLAAAWHSHDCGCRDWEPGDEDESFQRWADWLLASDWLRRRDVAVADRVLAPIRALFAGDPDTACRTTWRDEPNLIGLPPDRVECVEVPMDQLRAALDEAEKAEEWLAKHDAEVARAAVQMHHAEQGLPSCGFDTEAYASAYNDGYEAAVTQGLADDPSLAQDWLARHDAEVAAAALEDAVKAVQSVYDLQCPVDSEDAYVSGARWAHQWWETVLGGTLRDLRDRAKCIREEATT